jgi:hypothetical protein
MVVRIKIFEKPELKNPIAVCGLPGSGYVGKLAVEHLARELNAKKFAEVYCYAFPPQVTIRQNGSVDMIKNELYYWKSKNGEYDLIIYTGDSQPVTPEAEYEVSDRVTELIRELGAKTLFTLAAFITGAFTETPRVYGTATDVDTLEELKRHGVQLMNEGNITGMNGLLVGFAKMKDIKGVCLLGETSGYIVDPKAAQSVLEVFTKILGIKIDMSNLEKRALETGEIVRTIREMQRRRTVKPKERGKEDLGYIS